MAMLKSSVVQGSLRVTDTTYTTNLNLSSATASRLLGTDANKNVVSIDMTVAAPTASNTATAFITTVSQGADGKISASKANLPTASTSVTGIMKVGTGLSVSSGTVSVSYGSTTNTAVQGDQTIFTLNGSAKNSGSSASFYAPTSGGSVNQILYSDGSNEPGWTTAATISSDTSNSSGTDAFTTLTLGNNKNKNSTDYHSEGLLYLYSASTGSHLIRGTSTTGSNYSHMLPNATGWIVTGGNGSSTGAGDQNTPVYLKTDGTLAAITSYDGNAATATKWASAQIVYVALGTASTSTTIQGDEDAVALGINGTLKVGNGGTGTSSAPTKGGIIYAASTSQYASTGIGTVGNPLVSGSANAPTWHGGVTLTGSSANDYAANFSGTLTVNGTTTLNSAIVGKDNFNYGTALPSGNTTGRIYFQISSNEYELPTGGTTGQALIKASGDDRDVMWGSVGGIMRPDTTNKYYVTGSKLTTENTDPAIFDQAIYVQGSVLYGAAWNDYAEYREADTVEPGRVVIERGDDTLYRSTERLMSGAEIISDTYGFAIGETPRAKTPIATSGRVLAYPYEDREVFRYNIGKPVCSGPNGTVSIMTQEEYEKYGYCAIGTISAVPDYEEWGEKKAKVNGRVWIRVK